MDYIRLYCPVQHGILYLCRKYPMNILEISAGYAEISIPLGSWDVSWKVWNIYVKYFNIQETSRTIPGYRKDIEISILLGYPVISMEISLEYPQDILLHKLDIAQYPGNFSNLH